MIGSAQRFQITPSDAIVRRVGSNGSIAAGSASSRSIGAALMVGTSTRWVDPRGKSLVGVGQESKSKACASLSAGMSRIA